MLVLSEDLQRNLLIDWLNIRYIVKCCAGNQYLFKFVSLLIENKSLVFNNFDNYVVSKASIGWLLHRNVFLNAIKLKYTFYEGNAVGFNLGTEQNRKFESFCSKLVILSVDKLYWHGNHFLHLMKRCENLQEVEFTNCILDDEIFVTFLVNLPQDLKRIDLHGCANLSVHSMSKFFTKHKQLLSVNLSGCNRLNDMGMLLLFSYRPLLQVVDVSHCGLLTNRALRTAGTFGKELLWLNISGCFEVTDVGVRAVVECCEKLATLIANNCDKVPALTMKLANDMFATRLATNHTTNNFVIQANDSLAWRENNPSSYFDCNYSESDNSNNDSDVISTSQWLDKAIIRYFNRPINTIGAPMWLVDLTVSLVYVLFCSVVLYCITKAGPESVFYKALYFGDIMAMWNSKYWFVLLYIFVAVITFHENVKTLRLLAFWAWQYVFSLIRVYEQVGM